MDVGHSKPSVVHSQDGWTHLSLLTLPGFMHAGEDENLATPLPHGFHHLNVVFPLDRVRGAMSSTSFEK